MTLEQSHKPCIIITTTSNFIQYGILIFYFPDSTRLHVRVPKFSKFSGGGGGGACPQTPLESSAKVLPRHGNPR